MQSPPFEAAPIQAGPVDSRSWAESRRSILSCSTLTIGALPTAGSITSAGQTNCYTFSGTTGDHARLRVVKTSGTLVPRVTIERPNGTTVCGPTTATDVTCPLDATGTHTVVVGDSSGTNTGGYVASIQRLNSPVGCTALSFGTAPTTLTLVAGQMKCATFAGATGDQVRSRVIVTSGTLFVLQELIRPNGTTICNPSGATQVTCPLDATGVHTIMFEDEAGTNTGGYSIAVQRLNGPVGCTALTLGAAPTAGTVSAAGQTNCYTFSGSAGDQIRLRLIKTSGSMSPSQEVLRPNGTTLCGPGGGGDLTCALTDSGTQAILVEDQNGINTGAYVISVRRLNSTTGCATVTFGSAPTTGTLTGAGRTNCYKLKGKAGNRIRVRMIVTSGTLFPLQEVIRPNGTTICSPSGAAEVTCLLDTTGTYTILVEDEVGTNTGGYSIAVQRLNGPVGCTALSLGAAPTAGTLSAAGQMNCYTFSGSAGEQIRLRLVKTSGSLNPSQQLINPNGTTLCGPGGSGDLTCALTDNGTQAILVEDQNGINAGAYVIAVRRLDSNAGCTAVTFGSAPTTGTVTAAGQTNCYSVSGTAGNRIRVRMIVTSGTLFPLQEVIRPSGTTVCSPSGAAQVTCLLDTTGTHTILIEDEVGTNTGGYSIAVQRLNGPVGCTALTFGAAPTAGTVSAAGQTNCYTISGSAGDQIRLRLVKTSGSLNPSQEVIRPNGTTLCGPSGSGDLTCALTDSGTHAILVEDQNGINTGAYVIAVRRLNSATGCTTVTFGSAPTTGTVSAAGQTNCYSVSGTAGNRIRVRMIVTSGTLFALQEVVRPNGTTICSPSGAAQVTCLLDTTGTHTILVEDSVGTSSGAYSIAVQRLNGPVGCTALTVGAGATAGSISAAGQMNCYTFSGTAGQSVDVHSVHTSGALVPSEELLRADGTTACGPSGAADLICTLDTVGTYTILVEDQSGTNTGAYTIRVS